MRDILNIDKLFTGQREITGLGIYHYGARFYPPKLGRFLSADTIVPGYANPQNLNRYAYVLNNPLRYTDPTGHRICEDYQGQCMSEDQMTTIWNNTTGNNNNNNNNDDDDGGGGIQIPSYVYGSYNSSQYLFGLYQNQCPGYCHRAQVTPSTGLAYELGGGASFLHDALQSYGMAWSFEEMARPIGSNPDVVSRRIYGVVAALETAGTVLAGIANLFLNSNGPTINTNPITPTSSPTSPTGTPVPTATGVTPTITWTPSPTTPPSTPSATLSVTLTSGPTMTTTTTPVYWVP